MKVSVVIPAYNVADHISATLDSVYAQSHRPLEVVVVDDGSTDATASTVGTYPGVRLFRQPNAGPAAARNLGVAKASGDLVSFIDADDLWPEGRLEWQLAYLAEHPEVDIVHGLVHCVSMATGQTLGPGPGPCLLFGTGTFRPRAFQQVGPIDEGLRLGEDTDWFMRAREAGLDMRIVERTSLIYRRHPSSLTGNTQDSVRNLARLLKRSVDRRKAVGAADNLAAIEVEGLPSE